MKRKTVSIIKVCCFTEKAKDLYEKLSSSLPEIIWIPLENKEDLNRWTKDAFEKSIPLLFISAAGIATRTISPFVKDKLTDCPVLVMDEEGKFIIPILSGHLGNANQIAQMISKKTGTQAVITTATDVNEKFSVDNFAKANGFRIVNRDGIKNVSSRVLSGEKICVYIDKEITIKDNNIPKEIILTKNISSANVAITTEAIPEIHLKKTLNLVAKKYCLGMGCKKGKSFEELKIFAEEIIKERLNSKLKDNVYSLSSIDLKEKEIGLAEFSHYLHIPFETFSTEELLSAEGSFSESNFVKETTGVSNVCERAAALSAGKNYRLLIQKTSANGITLSVAEKIPKITTWKFEGAK
ncbi:cobalt-precorrin 5A hydrolase [Treponema sp.]|uniref:cobalt-precorrin 5A hydrolase n=1 Tax=Treponema sp. TaxID=166 RepID=UPI00298E344A|nr:cobalamin biosynthesis protein [Treponema sp.]MCQ2240061.1 cobalamin biosynthesis protein [Treponema sp.]